MNHQVVQLCLLSVLKVYDRNDVLVGQLLEERHLSKGRVIHLAHVVLQELQVLLLFPDALVYGGTVHSGESYGGETASGAEFTAPVVLQHSNDV